MTGYEYVVEVNYEASLRSLFGVETAEVEPESEEDIEELMYAYDVDRCQNPERYQRRRGIVTLGVRLAPPPERVLDYIDAKRQILKEGEEFMDLCEMLHFGLQHPDIQRRFYILAMETWWDTGLGVSRIGALGGNGTARSLHSQIPWKYWRKGTDVRYGIVRQ